LTEDQAFTPNDKQKAGQPRQVLKNPSSAPPTTAFQIVKYRSAKS
jgi:hypothetical protein